MADDTTAPPASVAVAVVGSGPAGCYAAQALRKALPDAEVTVFERLAVPFGLVRYGVAPDHQHTKSIQTQFARIFERDGVRFAGGLEIGTDAGSDLTLEQLRSAYDAVVLATGLTRDRALGVPGDDLPVVHGAGRLTRLFNGHPDEAGPLPELGGSVVVVGGGNVSVDVVRLLLKGADDFAGSDVDPALVAELAAQPVRVVHLVSRSGAEAMRSDGAMLAELGRVPGVVVRTDDPVVVSADASRPAVARATALAGLLGAEPPAQPRAELVLHLGWAPTAVEEVDGGARVHLASSTGGERVLEAGSVVTAVGFEFAPEGHHGAVLEAAETGRVADGLYRTGWLRRGARGTVAENRACARTVAQEVLDDLAAAPRQGATGPRGWEALPSDVRARAVDVEGWRRIDAHEVASAPPGRVRCKLRTHEELLAVARTGADSPAPAGAPGPDAARGESR